MGQSNDVVENSPLDISEIQEDSTNLESSLDTNKASKGFKIEQMPAQWTALTDISQGEGEFAIQEYCDSDVPSLSFYQEEDDWWFTSFSGQEGLTWKVLTFEGAVHDNFGSELISGYFVLESQNILPSDTISFSWPTNQKMCQFEDLGMPNQYFVSDKNLDNYSRFEANCDDYFEEP